MNKFWMICYTMLYLLSPVMYCTFRNSLKVLISFQVFLPQENDNRKIEKIPDKHPLIYVYAGRNIIVENLVEIMKKLKGLLK